MRAPPLLLIFPLLVLSAQAADPEAAKFHVVGYLPEYRIADFNGDSAMGLTDLVYFSAEPTAQGDLRQDRLTGEALAKLRAIKERHGLKVLLTVGGWGRSSGFAKMSASSVARERFVVNVTRFCREQQFDGIDLDWEHPADNLQRENYNRLITSLKKGFESRGLILTVAIADWQALSADATASVDRIHLMAYDAPGRHSTYEFATTAVNRLIEGGVPAEKICLGVPFYGRDIKQGGRSMTYAEILDKLMPVQGTDEVDGIYFNGPETIQRKTRFALVQRLGGVMVWELGQDVAGERSLLKAINRAVDER